MIIEPVRIPEEGRAYAGDEPAAILELAADALLKPVGPIHYDLKAILVTGQLVVTGRVGARFTGPCCRCGCSMELEVVDPEFACDREIKDPTLVVDLTEDLRESILLVLPPYPVCRTECRGLCPRCGKNLNKATCKCKPLPPSGWEALSAFKVDDKA